MGLKVGRNDPCPCGSGKKYKVCCLPLSGKEKSDMNGQAKMLKQLRDKSLDKTVQNLLWATNYVNPLKAACVMVYTADDQVGVMPYVNPDNVSDTDEFAALRSLVELLSLEWGMFITGKHDPNEEWGKDEDGEDVTPQIEMLRWGQNTLERKMRTILKYISEYQEAPSLSKSDQKKLEEYRELLKDHDERLQAIDKMINKLTTTA